MKIIAIGRNYINHAREMNSPPPEVPVFFMKPDTALLRRNRPFYFPDFSKEIHYEAEVVLRIGKNGKNIDTQYAGRYYEAIGMGIDLTARDIQRNHKQKGLPWEKAKGFDSSAPLSDTFIPMHEIADPKNISFSLEINGKVVQKGNTADMIFSFEQLIAHISQFITLKTGDLIFTGTPEGVGPVKIGDRLKGILEGQVLLDFEIK